MKYKAINNTQAAFFQKKLANFLKNHRIGEDVKSKDMADYLGYTPQKYSQMESDRKPYDRFVNTMDYLTLIANLEDLTVTELMAKIEGTPIRKIEEKIEINKRPLPSKLIDIFKNMSPSKLEKTLEIISILSEKNETELAAFLALFR